VLAFLRAWTLQLGNVLLDELVTLVREQVPHGLFGCHVLWMLLFLGHEVTYARYEYEPR